MIKDPYHTVSNYNTSNILFTIIKSKNFEQNCQSLVLHKLFHYKFEYKIQFFSLAQVTQLQIAVYFLTHLGH